jgi:integrase
MNNGQWSVYYVAVFKDWTGKNRRIRLSTDLKTARILLKELEVKNDKKIDLDAEKKAKQQRENAMTIAKWIPLCKRLPEMHTKKNGQPRRSLDRDNQLYAHIIRLMGNKQLAEISRADLEAYKKARGSETLFRCGKWTKVPVSSGTIRNELAALRRVLNLARLHKNEMAENNGIVYQVSDLSFEGILPNAHTRARPLKASEKKTLLPACSPWLRRSLIVAMETCLSRGDLLRLTWDDIDWDEGVIVPGGGRKKTQVRQVAPLTETVRSILEEIKQEATWSSADMSIFTIPTHRSLTSFPALPVLTRTLRFVYVAPKVWRSRGPKRIGRNRNPTISPLRIGTTPTGLKRSLAPISKRTQKAAEAVPFASLSPNFGV